MGHKSTLPIFGDEDYWNLGDLSVPLSSTPEDGSFTLCLWIYLVKTCFTGSVIRMVCSETNQEWPLLTIGQDKKLSLHSLDDTSVSAQQVCPTEKWVHIGCEIGADVVRLHLDGVVVAEKHIEGPKENKQLSALIFKGGNGSCQDIMQGYAHYVRVLPQPTVTNHYVKHPPLELSLDGSTGATEDHELEEGGDGIWSVVGGKASCRRNFALDVVLLDALGRSVHKDMEIMAMLVYADNGSPVEKPKDDAEAPLLTTFDGVEFPSTERPIKLVHGRASFKLKISQLSSKCDNRLFRVCFDSPTIPSYPFLRVFSRPIRCVSRNRNNRVTTIPVKRPVSSIETTWFPEESVMETPSNHNGPSNVQGASKCYPSQYPAKRVRLGLEESKHTVYQPKDPCDSSQNLSAPDMKAFSSSFQMGTRTAHGFMGSRGVSSEQMYPSLTIKAYPTQNDPRVVTDQNLQQGSLHECSSFLNSYNLKTSYNEALSDFFVFKYSIESIHNRAAFLRGAIARWTDNELLEFGRKVSHVTSCEHNGHQIHIAKKLIQEGNKAWKQIVNETYPVPWDVAVENIENHFLSMSNTKERRFSSKDKVFLRRLAKCKEYVSREEFDRLWYWIYPITMSLLNPRVKKTWDIDEPRWILGMVSRDEAEALLIAQDPPRPGMFILRFVSTCSWPHPDAGSLIISYIGPDLRIHHKLISLDNLSGYSIGDQRSLDEIILAQGELHYPFR